VKQSAKRPVETRRTILAAAGAEFTAHGYAGSGLGAITTRAGMTKGALFHHFPDKRNLAVAWISESLREDMARLWIAPLAEVASLDALGKFMRGRVMEMDGTDPYAAWVLLSSEAALSDAGIADALLAISAEWLSAITAVLDQGKSMGWIHRSIRPEDEALFLSAALSGFTVTFRTDAREVTRRRCAATLEAYLETLRAQ
jgi:AcrR family transcriptional regulator